MPEAGFIRRTFAAISPRYDLLNRVLSFGVDRRWRRRVVAAVLEGIARQDGGLASGARSAGSVGVSPARPESNSHVLDLCCGTADLALELASAGLRATGADFCHEMLVIGRGKVARHRNGNRVVSGLVSLAEADALRLPFLDATFSGATVAFGVRNLQDLDAGLAEIRRVLKPGGRLTVLEFGSPRGTVVGPLYAVYLNVVVPIVGRFVSGSREAYSWLSSSIQAFPDQAAFPGRLTRAGFADVQVESLTFGVAALYVAERPAS